MAETIWSEPARLAQRAAKAGWSCTFARGGSRSFTQSFGLPSLPGTNRCSVTIIWRARGYRLLPERCTVDERPCTVEDVHRRLVPASEVKKCPTAETVVRRAILSGWDTDLAWTREHGIRLVIRSRSGMGAEFRMSQTAGGDGWALTGLSITPKAAEAGVRCSLHSIRDMAAFPNPDLRALR